MDIMMMMFQGIALVGLLSLPFAVYLTWKTTDAIFFTLLMVLICALCGFITMIGVYDWITYVQ